MKEYSNVFGTSARYYDLDEREAVMGDIPFYLNAASSMGEGLDILELACGTGRVAIPMAEAGHKVTGLDISNEMLAVFRGKVEALNSDVAARIDIAQGAMEDFNLNKRFDLIIIPFRSFQALTAEKDILSCLLNVEGHLKANGRFIVDVFNPYMDPMDGSWVYPRTLLWEKELDGKVIRRYHRGERIDIEEQVIYPVLEFEVTDPSGGRESYEDRLMLRYYYPEQLRGVLEGAGFDILEGHGDYKGRLIEEGSPEIIYICGKPATGGATTMAEPCYIIAV